MDTRGARMRWSAEVCLAWLSCFTRRCDCAGAEDAWRRMQQRGIAFDCDLYCKMLQIYIGSGEAAQLAKAEPLYAQMRGRSGKISSEGQHAPSLSPSQQPPPPLPLRFSLHHFEQLIQAAHHAHCQPAMSDRKELNTPMAAADSGDRTGLDAELLKWSGRLVAAGMAEQMDSHVFQMVRQAIRRLSDADGGDADGGATIAAGPGHGRGRPAVTSSLRADPRDVPAKVAFMAELFGLRLERLISAAEARGLHPLEAASREELIGRLVGGASSDEIREAARLSCNRADVD
jgi:pentatricopeptide repeat protein